jgi:hypothetical protein
MFAVLQVGGFLGLGKHLVAVPYESLQIDDDGKKIVLPDASKDELKTLAEFKYPTRAEVCWRTKRWAMKFPADTEQPNEPALQCDS